MVLEHINGLINQVLRDGISMIKNKGMANSEATMGKFLKENGKMANGRDREY